MSTGAFVAHFKLDDNKFATIRSARHTAGCLPRDSISTPTSDSQFTMIPRSASSIMAFRTRIGIGFLALFSLTAVSLIAGSAVWYARSPRQLNVLLITLDSTRADRLGCYGYSLAKTPVLDGLAQQGVLFERAYSPAPLTLPSHASILTGLYPPEHTLRENGRTALPKGIPTLATKLQAAGYETGAFVSAFPLNNKSGLQRGFKTYNDELSLNDSRSLADPSLQGHYEHRNGNLVTDAALRWLRPRVRKPFFCWVHLVDPHFPYQAHEDQFGTEFKDQPYDAELAHVDQQLDRLISSLRDSGALENTMIVVVGDHGESLGQHGEQSHSMTVYDATLRVPLLIVSPGEGQAGHRVSEPVSLVDLTPTVLDRLGLRPLPQASGRSLRGALRGKQLAAQSCYAESDEPYRAGHWSPLRTLITSQWKYIRSPRAELYDLSVDPGELRNLATEAPDQLQKLEGELSAWEEKMNPQLADVTELPGQQRREFGALAYASSREQFTNEERPLRDVKDMLPFYYKLNDAAAMLDARRYDMAEPILRDVLAADTECFAAHGELGRCLSKQKRYPEAIESLKRAVQLNPAAEQFQSMLGATQLLNGDFLAAVETLEQAIRLNPDLEQNQLNLGLAMEKLGKPDKAIKHYQKCLEQSPDTAQARQRLAFLRSR
jgi:arylsulfatase A-like enzyme